MSELEPTRTYSNHTANDELRELLDERGVEWQDFDGELTWMGSDGEMHYARQEFTFDGLTDSVTVYHLTPEQAVEATLGSGTCHMEYRDEWSGDELYPTEAYMCSACKYVTVDGKPNYCQNCGRKVVDA